MARLLGFLLFMVCVAGVAIYVAPPRAPRGFSGLEFAAMTPSAAARAPLLATRGALIYQVVADSPATAAGIKPGEVVAAIDGTPIISARQASDIIRGKRSGEQVRLTLFDEAKGEIHPRQVQMTLTAAAPVTRKLSVKPPRTLAKEFFFQPSMAANASWSRRLTHGPSIRPLSLAPLGTMRCSGFAPDDWTVLGDDEAGSVLHVTNNASHAMYKILRLSDAQARDPRGFILGLLHAIFKSPPVATPVQSRPFGFSTFNFGTSGGAAGFAVWRMTGSTISLWIAAVPASDAAWAEPLAVAVAFSLRCNSGLERPALPFAPALVPVTVSLRCLQGACGEGDFAATYLEKFRLGYVHGANQGVYLINPRRDFWQTGPEGPGFYRQVGGTNEKLEPGRTN